MVDSDAGLLRGIARLLNDAGLQATTITDPEQARDQLANRFIPVALFDLDTPTPGGGIDLVKFTREKAPLTVPLIMTPRKGFEAVAPAFRAGAADVIPKTQDSIAYLRDRVLAAAAEVRATSTREELLRDMAEVHDDFLKQMMEVARQVTDLEDRLMAREEGGSISVVTMGPLQVLVIDDEPALAATLYRELTIEKGWRIVHRQSGGEGLDSASSDPPQVLVVKEMLPDLPGRMVVKTVKASAPDAVALLFTPPADGRTGEVKMVDQSRLLTLIPSFRDPAQLIASLQEVREALRQKGKERRHLQTFRKQHFEFLKRFNQLKQRIAEARSAPR